MQLLMSSSELKLWIKSRLPEKRYLHSLSVAETAVMLANKFAIDSESAEIAGLYHDAYRYIGKEDALKDLKDHNFTPLKDEEENENLLHAPVAAVHMREDLGPVPDSFIKAVRFHTLGSKDMGALGAIIYIADYAEPRRKHLSDKDREFIFSRPTLEDMVLTIIEAQNEYFKKEGIANAEITDELYEFLKRGGHFEA